jgi:hypothetical protein
MDHAENNDSSSDESKETIFILKTISQSRAFTQVPLNPKIEFLIKKVEKASSKLLYAKYRAIHEGDPHSEYFEYAEKCYLKKLKMLMNFALKIDAELHQADLN